MALNGMLEGKRIEGTVGEMAVSVLNQAPLAVHQMLSTKQERIYITVLSDLWLHREKKYQTFIRQYVADIFLLSQKHVPLETMLEKKFQFKSLFGISSKA